MDLHASIRTCTVKTMNNETAQKIADAIENHPTETPSSVALKTGIPRTTLGRKLVGGTEFGVYEIARIAIALDCDPEEFLPKEYKRVTETKKVA